jgi:phosphate transport system permease protein
MRMIKEKIYFILAYSSLALTIFILGSIIFYTFLNGFKTWSIEFFLLPQSSPLNPHQGIAHAIQGSVIMSFTAAIIATPISILAAIYLTEYSSIEHRELIDNILDVMASIPSIVVGIVAYLLFVEPFHSFSAFSGGMALSIMMIPIMTRSTEEALLSVGREYREAGLALGLPKWKVSTHIVVNIATNGILTGFILAFGRIFGETAPLLFTARGSKTFFTGFFNPTSSITLLIYEYSKSPFKIWIDIAWGASAFLMLLILLINLLMRYFMGGGK